MSDVNVGKARKRQRPKAVRPAAAPRLATGDEPDLNDLVEIEPDTTEGYAPTGWADAPPVADPVNPWAPTGWAAKARVEFDVKLPMSGQFCRLIRMERDDLFRLDLVEYLNTFLPLLMDDATISAEAQQSKMEQTMKDDPSAITKMLRAIDIIAMTACVKPKITEDENLVDIGGPDDWANPNFIATVPLRNIPVVERMFIFGAAFGRSMDDLKSLLEQAESLDGLGDFASIQQNAK